MPPAFSVRTIQQCSIPSLCVSGVHLKKKSISSPTSKGKKMFDVRMVSHESK